jgi:hypothetical protein
MAHCRGAETRYRKNICEAVSDELHLEDFQNAYADSLIHGLALGKKLVMHQTLRVIESDHHSSMDVRPFLNWEYHSDVLDRLNAVSPNACCSIWYVSVAVLPSFWQNLMQTRCSFNTSISQYDGGTNTIAL